MDTSTDQVAVHFFSARTERNLRIGYDRRLWAIPDGNETYLKGRFAVSRRMGPGSLGLIFCADKEKCQYFAMPFKVLSFACNERVTDIWPETWALPFEIEPLGNPRERIESLDMAKRTWKCLQGGINPANALYLAATLAFTPAHIFQSDWQAILKSTGLKVEP